MRLETRARPGGAIKELSDAPASPTRTLGEEIPCLLADHHLNTNARCMSRISTNNAFQRIIGVNNQSAMRTLERLSTGYAINRGADDPAGLIASENFQARLSANQAQITSIERNEAFMNIRDGALGAQLDNIGDLDGLVVQAANEGGTTGSETGAVSTQVDGIISGIERVLPATGIDIMRDVTTQMQVGTDEVSGDPIYEEVSMSDLSRVMEQDPEAAQRLVDGARDAVLQERAQIGADQRAAEAERRVLEEEQINIAQANSSIRDAEYARESSNLVRDQILGEASIAAELASRASSAAVLRLLDLQA